MFFFARKKLNNPVLGFVGVFTIAKVIFDEKKRILTMFNEIGTYLSVLNAFLIGCLIVLFIKFKENLPDIDEVLSDVGADISNKLSEIFQEAPVKRAMSVLGKESGKSRASEALKNKVAEKAIGSNIVLKKALEYFDISPMEGLQLLNDPTMGPMIKGVMANFQGGLSQGGSSSPGGGLPRRNNGGRNQVPNMS